MDTNYFAGGGGGAGGRNPVLFAQTLAKYQQLITNPEQFGGVVYNATDCALGTVASVPNRVLTGAAATQSVAGQQPTCVADWIDGSQCLHFTTAGNTLLVAPNLAAICASPAGFTIWALIYADSTNRQMLMSVFNAGNTDDIQIEINASSRGCEIDAIIINGSTTYQCKNGTGQLSNRRYQFVSLVLSPAGYAQVCHNLHGLDTRPALPLASATPYLTCQAIGNYAVGGYALSGKLRAFGAHPTPLSRAQLLGIARGLGCTPCNVHCQGDDLTAGNGVTPAQSYPAQLQALFDVSGSSWYYCYNYGIPSTGTPEMIDRLSDPALNTSYTGNVLTDFSLPNPCYELIAPDPGRLNIVDLDGAGNDLYLTPGATVQSVLANVAALVAAHAKNGEIVITQTITPRGTGGGWPSPSGRSQAQWNADALLINLQLLANPGSIYGYAIQDDATSMPDPTNGTYYTSDQVHHTIAGYTVKATNAKAWIVPLL